MNSLKFIIGFLILGSVACSKNEDNLETPRTATSAIAATASSTTSTLQGVTLKTSLPFRFGAAVNINFLKKNEAYRNLVIKEYSSLTAESGMKISVLHPAENTWEWYDADYLVNFAIANNQRVHGHTLIWDSSLPSWVKNYQGNAAAWEKLFKTHIQTIVGHFKGRVASWDVVNEAFNSDGTVKQTIWYKKLGSDYIARAFKYAHEADPNAILFLNDYGHENGNNKRRGIIAYVNALVARGIPIHGLGLQMHTRYNLPDANFAKAINESAATGLKIHISELDISLNPSSDQTLTLTPELLALQAAKYKFIVQTFNALPKSQQFGITTWNVTDGDSWVPKNYNRPDWPLPFDSTYNKKPAYQGILDGIK